MRTDFATALAAFLEYQDKPVFVFKTAIQLAKVRIFDTKEW